MNTNWLITIVGIFLLLGVIAKYADAQSAEDYCFEKAYSESFIPPATPRTFRVLRGRLKRKIRQCRSVHCLLQTFPNSRRKVLVVYKRRGSGYVTYGNLAWANKNFFLGRRDQLGDALLIAAGVEYSSLGTDLVTGDLEFHDRLAFEHRCLRRRGESALSFNQVVQLP